MQGTLGVEALPGSGCSWKAPKSAAGKKPLVKVTAAYGGASYTTSLSLRVLRK